MTMRCLRHAGRTHALSITVLLLVVVVATTPAVSAETGKGPLAPAYIVHSGATPLTVLDTTQRTVAGTVPSGPAATRMALSPAGTRAYVTSSANDSITVVDVNAAAELTQFGTGGAPGQIAVSRTGSRLFVLLDSGVLQVLDAQTGAELDRLDVGASGGMALHPNGRLYVAAGPLIEIDTTDGTVRRTIPVTEGTGAHDMVLAPDGRTAYVLSSEIFTGGVDVVDLETGEVVARVGLGSIPGPVAIAPDGDQLFVAIAATFVDTGYGAGWLPGRSIAVIDTASRERTSTIDLGADGSAWTLQNTAAGLAVTPDGATVLASVPRLSAVLVANRSTGVVEETIATAAGPRQLVVPTPAPVDAIRDAGRTAAAVPGTVVPNVLANDTAGGVTATLSTVRLRQVSTTSPDVALDGSDGSVDLLHPATSGRETLVYRVCSLTAAQVCDRARVTVRLTG